MPMSLEHIDKIARDKQRDVLYIEFDREVYPSYDYETYIERQNLIKWLEENNIPYMPCGHIASEYGWESYIGQLYIDIPMDDNNSKYKLLNNHLENEDGSFKIKGVRYMYVSLKVAMKNAHHDEEGFWDRWAENF